MRHYLAIVPDAESVVHFLAGSSHWQVHNNMFELVADI